MSEKSKAERDFVMRDDIRRSLDFTTGLNKLRDGRYLFLKRGTHSSVLVGNSITAFAVPQEALAPGLKPRPGQDEALRGYRPITPPIAPIIDKPLLTAFSDFKAVDGNNVGGVNEYSFLKVAKTGYDTTGGKTVTIAPARTPRIATLAIPPISEILGQRGSGDVPFDGMNEEATETVTAVAKIITEVVEVPDNFRAEKTRRLTLTRRDGVTATSSHKAFLPDVIRVKEEIPEGRSDRIVIPGPVNVTVTYLLTPVPESVIRTGLMDQIATKAAAAMKARYPNQTLWFLRIKFAEPAKPKYLVSRMMAHKVTGATFDQAGMTVSPVTTSDHNFETHFVSLPASESRIRR